MSDLRLLRDKNLLVMSEESVAFITPWGWWPLPNALAEVVRAALAPEAPQTPQAAAPSSGLGSPQPVRPTTPTTGDRRQGGPDR